MKFVVNTRPQFRALCVAMRGMTKEQDNGMMQLLSGQVRWNVLDTNERKAAPPLSRGAIEDRANINAASAFAPEANLVTALSWRRSIRIMRLQSKLRGEL